MKITIRKFTAKDTKDWDDFVNQSNNGTIFHLRSFLSYHIDRKFIDHSLIFEKNGEVIAVFPATVEKKNGKNILYSHPGASFGGFVLHKISFEDANNLVIILEQYSIQNKFETIFFVDTPSIYHRQLDDTLEYLLYWHNFNIEEYYISSKINIYQFPNVLDHLNARKKRYVKSYLENKELTIKLENDFDQFYPILVENKKKHNVTPTHSLEELRKLNELQPRSLHLLLLYYKNIIIGGTLNFIVNENCGMVFYNMINYDYINLQPATIQIFESINWAKKLKLKYLDLGVSQQPKAENPLTPHQSLINFKEQLGATTIIRKAFQKIIS